MPTTKFDRGRIWHPYHVYKTVNFCYEVAFAGNFSNIVDEIEILALEIQPFLTNPGPRA